MAYTHRWRQKDDVPPETWQKIVTDFRTLLEHLPARTDTAGGYYKNDPLKLANGLGVPGTVPLANDIEICFNGEVGHEGSSDLSYETMHVVRERFIEDFEKTAHPSRHADLQAIGTFNFCKTARKPYDLVVCGLLLLMQHHAAATFVIESDGGRDDWEPAIEWVGSVLGYQTVPLALILE